MLFIIEIKCILRNEFKKLNGTKSNSFMMLKLPKDSKYTLYVILRQVLGMFLWLFIVKENNIEVRNNFYKKLLITICFANEI